ncbi:MAG: dCMP deaminase family protein [Erysipelotrichaceae bacterium]|nr:dCMP deaminase family protein [Erysipelotrichaceae bacterium]MBR6958363.1 dCMP deaminase family protein [Erysipelotrichaceae bacterium]
MKRQNVLDWNTYFMALAHLSAERSKDPNTNVGAVIVDDMHRIVSIGYNGMPRNCNDDEFPWEREGGFLTTKYAYVVHAELNAILNSPRSVSGCTLYVSLFPCNECAKAIIQSGIKRIYYESDKYAETEGVRASKKMLSAAGVEMIQLPYTCEVNVTVNER